MTNQSRSYPDWGVYESTIISPDIDNGEVVARLGGPRTRREGRILSYADFSPSTDGWNFQANSYKQYGTSFKYSGAIYFQHSTGAIGRMYKLLPNTSSLRVGLDTMLLSFSTFGLINLGISVYKGATVYNGVVTLNIQTGDVQFLRSDGVYVTLVPASDLVKQVNNWYSAKLVIDGDSNPPSYVRLLLNNITYLITSVGAQALQSQVASPAGYGTQFAISVSASGVPYQVFSDEVIITTNEY